MAPEGTFLTPVFRFIDWYSGVINAPASPAVLRLKVCAYKAKKYFKIQRLEKGGWRNQIVGE